MTKFQKNKHIMAQKPSILDTLAQVKAKLETISEKLRYAIMENSRETILDCSEQNAASKPHLAREAISEFCEIPVYDEYDEGNKSWTHEFTSLQENTIEQQKYDDEQPICGLEKLNSGENLCFATQDKEQLLKCFSIVSGFRNIPDVYVRRTCQEEPQGDEKLFREKYVCQTVTRLSILLFPWDPGATGSHVLFATIGAIKLHGTDAYKSEFTCSKIHKLLNTFVNLKMILLPFWKLQLNSPLKLFMHSLCRSATTVVQVTKQRHPLEFHLMNGRLQNEHLDKCLHKASPSSAHEQVAIWKYPCDQDINIGCSLKLKTEFSIADSSLPFQLEQLQPVQTQEYHMMLITEGTQEWDPGIETLSSIYLCLQGLTARIATEKPLSWLAIPELTKWPSQVTSASFVWDPGTMLPQYKFICLLLIPEQWSF